MLCPSRSTGCIRRDCDREEPRDPRGSRETNTHRAAVACDRNRDVHRTQVRSATSDPRRTETFRRCRPSRGRTQSGVRSGAPPAIQLKPQTAYDERRPLNGRRATNTCRRTKNKTDGRELPRATSKLRRRPVLCEAGTAPAPQRPYCGVRTMLVPARAALRRLSGADLTLAGLLLPPFLRPFSREPCSLG